MKALCHCESILIVYFVAGLRGPAARNSLDVRAHRGAPERRGPPPHQQSAQYRGGPAVMAQNPPQQRLVARSAPAIAPSVGASAVRAQPSVAAAAAAATPASTTPGVSYTTYEIGGKRYKMISSNQYTKLLQAGVTTQAFYLGGQNKVAPAASAVGGQPPVAPVSRAAVPGGAPQVAVPPQGVTSYSHAHARPGFTAQQSPVGSPVGQPPANYAQYNAAYAQTPAAQHQAHPGHHQAHPGHHQAHPGHPNEPVPFGTGASMRRAPQHGHGHPVEPQPFVPRR